MHYTAEFWDMSAAELERHLDSGIDVKDPDSSGDSAALEIARMLLDAGPISISVAT